MTLGERIHLIRRRQGLTQHALADAIGLNKTTIARLEQGNIKDLGGRAVAKLADVLGTTTDYLLGRTEESGVDSETVPTTGDALEDGAPVAVNRCPQCAAAGVA
jgi:transcriptional regulator with XRE-family HTH domain